jgi:hypothetical protein
MAWLLQFRHSLLRQTGDADHRQRAR